jgi:hypothetical protein
MSTVQQAQAADVRFKEICFEIQGLAQQYINEGTESPEMRNAIRGILALASGLTAVLNTALMRM